MILVNDPGDGRHTYAALEHASWNGWTPTDLVFPNFLFLIGCSIVFSVEARLRRGASRGAIALQMIRRAVTILALQFGIVLVPQFQFAHMRIFGVLTRIALCYLIAGLIFLITRRAASIAFVAAALLSGYWLLLRFVVVPGFGLPVRDVPLLDQVGNLTSWIDRGFTVWTQRWLHTGVLYRKTSDPEGLLSTLPAVATSLLGVLAGLQLTRPAKDETGKRLSRSTALNLLAAGVACLIVGEVWSNSFPINKNLWTSSFVLLAGGFSLVGLALAHSIFDEQRWHERSALLRGLSCPCLVFGSNAIVAYVLSELIVIVASAIHVPGTPAAMTLLGFVYRRLFALHGSTQNTSLAFACAYVAVCFLPCWLLWRKRIFVRV